MDLTDDWPSQMVQLVNNLPANAGNTKDVGLIPESGRSPRERNGNPLQYSCLENSKDREAWGGYSPWGCKESDTTEYTHTGARKEIGREELRMSLNFG